MKIWNCNSLLERFFRQRVCCLIKLLRTDLVLDIPMQRAFFAGYTKLLWIQIRPVLERGTGKVEKAKAAALFCEKWRLTETNENYH